MKKLLCLFSLLLLLFSCVSVEKYNTKIGRLHSPEDLHNDIDISYRKLKKLHPKLYQFVSNEFKTIFVP